jgi:hypothetical protein
MGRADGIAARPGLQGLVFAVSASGLPMSAAQDAAAPSGRHTVRAAAQPPWLVVLPPLAHPLPAARSATVSPRDGS